MDRQLPHKIKSWPSFFQAFLEDRKLHDIRSKDRDFRVGDTVLLQEYEPFVEGGRYTGRELMMQITYITSNDTPCALSSAVLDRDYCVLSLKKWGAVI